MRDPIVIDPPGFDSAAAWKECGDYVQQCGGIEHEDGTTNWRAAFGASPGICSCPSCHEDYWAWGRIHKCADCGFEYPTNAWAMFSWGVQAAWNREKFEQHRGLQTLHEKRLSHPYYRYGFENPPPRDVDLFALFNANDWSQMLNQAEPAPTHKPGGES